MTRTNVARATRGRNSSPTASTSSPTSTTKPSASPAPAGRIGPAQPRAATYTPPALLVADDAAWIEPFVAAARGAAGIPWRDLADRIDRLAAATDNPRIRTRTVDAISSVLFQLVAGKPERVTARAIRDRVLGSPVFDPAERTARFVAAATALDLDPVAVEQLMWSDLARERIVSPPTEPLDTVRIAALANVELIERLLARALHVRLAIHGSPRTFARIVARRGLLARVSRASEDLDSLVFEIVGPLSLFHKTAIYGRAIGSIVPHLAGVDAFVLETRLDYGRGEGIVTLESPILLPPAPRPAPPDRRLGRDLVGLGFTVVADPPAIRSGDRILFPDLIVAQSGGTPRPLEIVPFGTTEYLADKRAAYEAAGASPILVESDTDTAGVIVAFAPTSGATARSTKTSRKRGASTR